MHRAFHVGTWLRKMGVSSSFASCHLQAETQKHYLWDYIESQLVWQRLLRIFAPSKKWLDVAHTFNGQEILSIKLLSAVSFLLCE
mgnify:CR=1 FL=1